MSEVSAGKTKFFSKFTFIGQPWPNDSFRISKEPNEQDTLTLTNNCISEFSDSLNNRMYPGKVKIFVYFNPPKDSKDWDYQRMSEIINKNIVKGNILEFNQVIDIENIVNIFSTRIPNPHIRYDIICIDH